METTRPARILVVTDRTAATPELVAAIAARASRGPVQFRLLVPNPAHAEMHLLHPERHDMAEAAEQVLLTALPAFEEVAGGHVIGSVSLRHDPYDAVEEVLLSEPIDEIIVSMAPHAPSRWLHHDLSERLTHLNRPVTTVGAPEPH